MGWLIALGAFLLVMFSRVGAMVTFGGETQVYIVVNFIKLRLKQSEKKPKKPKKDKQPVEKPAAEPKSPKKPKRFKPDFPVLIDLSKRVLRKLMRLPRFDIFQLNITAAAKSPDKTALMYGRLWRVLCTAAPFCREWFRVGRRRKVRVLADYESEKISVSGRVQVTVSIGGTLIFLIWAMTKLPKILKMMKEDDENGTDKND